MKKRQAEKPSEMLLEREAAELLRCSTSMVKRLRLDRKLGYYQGRPVLISRADLEKYVASARCYESKCREKKLNTRCCQ
jgi:excisionase family DNA binding protein